MTLPVVVALDGSVESERALFLAMPMARALDTSLHLVRVARPANDSRRFTLLTDGTGWPGEDHSLAHAAEQTYLDIAVERARKEFSEERIVTALLDGPAPKAIAMYARQVHARVVVMARHELNGFPDESAGVVAARVSRLSGLPVLLIRPDQSVSAINWRCERIVVGLDGSTEAETILEYVRPFGLATNAQVTLVRVINPATAIDFGYPSVARTGALDALHPAIRAAEMHLGRLADGLRNQGLRVATRVLYGAWPQAEAINLVARDLDADLIAIATRTRAGADTECVAASLLRSAFAPVLVLSTAMVSKQRPDQERVDDISTVWRSTSRQPELQEVAD